MSGLRIRRLLSDVLLSFASLPGLDRALPCLLGSPGNYGMLLCTQHHKVAVSSSNVFLCVCDSLCLMR